MKLHILNSEDFIFFRTRDFALINSLSISAATEQLKRLETKSLIVKLTRGLWANTLHPYFSPYSASPYLLDNEQGYVSFLSALSRYGLISQIPQTIQVATSGRSRKLKTPIANYEFFQLGANMFQNGIVWTDNRSTISYPIASPEKALVDTLYISTRKSNRFSSLPEIDLSSGFNKKKFMKILNNSIKEKRIYNAILKRFDNLAQ
jgi:predicted transcriptional regulator of viral defense system